MDQYLPEAHRVDIIRLCSHVAVQLYIVSIVCCRQLLFDPHMCDSKNIVDIEIITAHASVTCDLPRVSNPPEAFKLMQCVQLTMLLVIS